MLPLTLGGIAGVQGPPWIDTDQLWRKCPRFRNGFRGPALHTSDMTLSKSTIESIEDIAFHLQRIQQELKRMNGTEALVDQASNTDRMLVTQASIHVDIRAIMELLKEQQQTIRHLSQRVTLLESIASQTDSAASDLSENCAD